MSQFRDLIALCTKYQRFPKIEDQGELKDYIKTLIETGFSTLTKPQFDKLCEVSSDVETMVVKIRDQAQNFESVLEFCKENNRLPSRNVEDENATWKLFTSIWNRKKISRGPQIDALRAVSPEMSAAIREYEKSLVTHRHNNDHKKQIKECQRMIKTTEAKILRISKLLEEVTGNFETLTEKFNQLTERKSTQE